MASLLPSLQRGSHSIEDLTSCALAYIERDRQGWSASQRSAYDYLNRFFEIDVTYVLLHTQLKLRRNSTRGSEIIAKIGDLFLLEELDSVNFWYQFDTSQVARDDAIGETMPKTPQVLTESVRFNTAHPVFRGRDIDNRRQTFFSVLLHEAIHVFFFRFGRIPASYTGTYHYSGFNMVAEAIERRATALFGVEFDLHRLNGFITEIRATNEIDFTQAQLDKCFENRFTYNQAENTLFNHGTPVLPFDGGNPVLPAIGLVGARSRLRIKEAHDPLVGPSRYPVRSRGPDMDLWFVDLLA
jgi:hypothetical protein